MRAQEDGHSVEAGHQERYGASSVLESDQEKGRRTELLAQYTELRKENLQNDTLAMTTVAALA